jgi:uroporphyrinogen decarboxylase
MGFAAYLDLMYDQPDVFAQLMRVNEEFCVAWANAQLAAGATAICYFDPVSSPTIVPRDLYLRTGYEVARRTIARIAGPTATHLASGRVLPIADDVATTGTAVIGVGDEEDLAAVKRACQGKLTVLGNLNGIAMARADPADTARAVREAIAAAAPGGGFILSDGHGEIPWQVSEETLLTIVETVQRHGCYPIARADH